MMFILLHLQLFISFYYLIGEELYTNVDPYKWLTFLIKVNFFKSLIK